MVNIVIFGATSAIASATAKIFAEKNANILLIARNEDKIGAVLSDLKTRGANSVDSIIFDLSISNEHQNLFNELKQKMPNYDIALIAYGSLGDQKEGEEHFDSFQKEFETNFMSVVSLLTFLANDLSKRKQGTIAVISSVAGDRGRQSNYIYGAAKGALTLVLQGLRNRLFADNVNILTIKPGFVDSPTLYLSNQM